MRIYNKNMHQLLCILRIECARKTSYIDWLFVAENMTAKEIEKKFGKVVPDDAEEETRTRERGEDELSKLNKYFETDNTRSKADQAEARRKNKKIAIKVVKALLLEKFGKGNGVKFDIEGNTLVAYLYDEGIRHAVRRATPKKLAALQKADELFANATYLYSSKNDAHGKASNNKRLDNWDYFYTPLTIEGDKTQTAGIRIAIKTFDNGDSNIYDMEMKKAEPLANGARQALPARLPGGVYGSASTQSAAQQIAPVNGNDFGCFAGPWCKRSGYLYARR